MKKILIALALTSGLAAAASAQEITVSYGAYTQMDAINCHKGMSDVKNAWGALNLGLYIPVSKGISIGPSYSYSSARTKSFSLPVYEYGRSQLYGTQSFHNSVGYHAIMLNVKIDYYQNSIVKLYGHAGAGAVISHMMPEFGDSYNKGYFAGQISPVCAEVGLMPHLAIFGELGFGAQGLVQVGAKYQF